MRNNRAMPLQSIAPLYIAFTTLAAAMPVAAAAADLAAAVASDASDDSAYSSALQEVTVSARKRNENIQDVPATVTGISGDLIQRVSLDSAIDVAKYAPNVNAWNNDGRERPRYYIRGVGNGNVSNNAVGAVGVYNDEIYLNSLVLQGFPLFDLDRVEVLNGPQGTLWGKNATAGAINYVSRIPEFRTEGYAQVGVGNYSQKDVQAAFGGSAVDNVLATRVAVRYESQDPWATNTYNGSDAGGFSDLAARFQLLGNIGDYGTALLNLHVRRLDGRRTPYYSSTQPSKAALPALAWSDVNTNLDNPQKLNSNGIDLKLNIRFSDLTLTSLSALEEGERTEFADGDGTPADVNRSYGRTKPRQISEELRLASGTDTRLSWLTGLYYLDETLQSYQTSLTPALAPPAVGYAYTRYEQDTKSAAAFANATLTVTDWLKLTAGIRWTHDHLDIDLVCGKSSNPLSYAKPDAWWLASSLQNPAAPCWPLQNPQIQSASWSKVNYEFEPQVKITPDILGYARVASGYRAGNFQGQVAPTTPPGVVNPETLLAYEVGLKSEWLDRRLTFNADVFYSDYKDIQVSIVQPAPTGIAAFLANAASGFAKGAEVEVRALPLAGLTVSANLGLLRTAYTDFNVASLSGSLSGKEFARAPRRTAQLAADYQWKLPAGALSIGTDWHYNSHYFYLATDESSPALQQKGYAVGNAHVSYLAPGDRFEVGATVQNLSREKYTVQVLPYQYGGYQYALGAPLTFLVSAKAMLN